MSLKGLPKWEPWAQIDVYLGCSLAYAGNVVLILNPSLDHVSPQYHIVFYDAFTLIPTLRMKTILSN
jgi:hypothetical protein